MCVYIHTYLNTYVHINKHVKVLEMTLGVWEFQCEPPGGVHSQILLWQSQIDLI